LHLSWAGTIREDALVQIVTEPDPTPIVRIMATTLRRSARDEKLAATMRKMHGVAALKSSTDPQAATLRFERGVVRLERGVAADVDVVIEADLATMNDPTPPKPKIAGAARHPQFALALGKVLDPPRGSWSDAARAYWSFAASYPGMPAALEVVETDTGERLLLGGGEPRVELHGSPHWLAVVLSGNSVLGEDILAGKVQFVGALKYLAVMTGRSIEWTLNGA
jgi:hypothetical protein